MSWHGKKIDPEELHGKEEWKKMQKLFLEQRYNGCVSEIEYILDTAFTLPDIFETPQNLESAELLQQPNYLSVNKNLVELLSGDTLQNEASMLKGFSKSDLLTEKQNLERHLKMIGEGCNKVFKAVAEVLRDYIKSEFDRIVNNDKSKDDKINNLDELIDQAHDLVAFFGVRAPENKAKSGGLIYGGNVEDCLISINHIGVVETILNSNSIPQPNDFSTDQSDVKLATLKKLQDIALPKAKEFMKVQFALNTNFQSQFSSLEYKLRDPDEVAHEFVNRSNYPEHPKSLSEIEIAKGIASKGSSDYLSKTILLFLKSVSNNPDLSADKQRNKAIESTNDPTVKDELAEVPTSTLYTWRKKIL